MISAVIPVYNEAACLPASASQIVAALEATARPWELVLVDDGSSDGTAAIVARLSAGDARVRGLQHERNRGKGAAVRTGVLATRGDAVLFCDADMSTPPDTLGRFLAALDEGADVVIGNRKSPEATIERWQPALRTWLGLGYTRLANAVMGLSIPDYTCGFKLLRGEPARRVFAEMETTGWSFDVELLARAARAGLRIEAIPVRWHHVADTRVRILRDTIRSFWELVAIRRRLGPLSRRSP